MPLSLKFAHGIFDGKITKFAGVLQFGMPELSLADRVRKSAVNKSGSHSHQEKNGEHFTTHSCTVQRRYRDGNEWKSTQSFRASDLLMISFAAQEAYRRLMEEKQKS